MQTGENPLRRCSSRSEQGGGTYCQMQRQANLSSSCSRESEMNVVAWCAQENNPFKCVRSIKLGHHGSATSTPYEMIRAFRPRNIIISADASLHGHPRKMTPLMPHTRSSSCDPY